MSRSPIAQATKRQRQSDRRKSLPREGVQSRSLARSVERREGRKGRSAGQPRKTKMEDADRGNVGLAPSGHDGTPIAPIARINAPVANGPVAPTGSSHETSPIIFPRGNSSPQFSSEKPLSLR